MCIVQNHSTSQKTADQIKRNISFARNYNYAENPGYNMDSLYLKFNGQQIRKGALINGEETLVHPNFNSAGIFNIANSCFIFFGCF